MNLPNHCFRPFINIIITAAFIIVAQVVYSQEPLPFAPEIRAFARQDSINKPLPGSILFVGSSSFRLWHTLQQDFKNLPVLNRGFGGASITDVIQYAQETIFRYQPRQIIFYCGENDLAASDTVTAATVVSRFIYLFNKIRRQVPYASFVFVSIKPSPSRAHLMPKIVEANKAIQQFLAQQKNTGFADVYHPMLQAETGLPRAELFGADSLHMNSKGYDLWRLKLAPYLK